ncbi:hypothetical protein V6Z11_D02G085500 [Gossypium hirsutum]
MKWWKERENIVHLHLFHRNHHLRKALKGFKLFALIQIVDLQNLSIRSTQRPHYSTIVSVVFYLFLGSVMRHVHRCCFVN